MDASEAGQADIEARADELIHDPEITPEKVVELRDLLRCGTGSTPSITVEPVPHPDAA